MAGSPNERLNALERRVAALESQLKAPAAEAAPVAEPEPEQAPSRRRSAKAESADE